MPELPEVQTTANSLNKLIRGLKITGAWTNYGGKFHVGKDNVKNPKFFRGFARKISGAKFTKIYRRGKNVLLELNNGQTILVHMKMTGHILYGSYGFDKKKNLWNAKELGPLQDSKNQFIRFVIALSNGRHIALSDMRKFAKITIIPTEKIGESSHLKEIGPEPLEKSFDFKTFFKRLQIRLKGKIKTVLMDQSILAGIGNIYSDEALWLTGIHPESVVEKIPNQKLKELFKNIILVLKKGIDFRGDSTSDYRNPNGEKGNFQNNHNVYRLKNTLCKKKDGGIIKRIVVGTRSAHFCPVHQKLFS